MDIGTVISIALISLSLVIGGFLGYFLKKRGSSGVSFDKYNALQMKSHENEVLYMNLKGRNDVLEESLVEIKQELQQRGNSYLELQGAYQLLRGEKRVLDEKMLELQKQFKDEFEILAKRIFEENSEKFTKVNKISIEGILNPLKENIDSFKKKVEETYDKEAKERFSLSDRVKELIEQTNKVSAEANNLASALKGQSKTRGNWGEMILESILQQSGLEKDREYFVQPNIKDEQGRNQRPDVIISLPDNRAIIIDSKVSLLAYDALMAADTPELQSRKTKEHILSVKAHVDSLHSKEYDRLEQSLDFTMMFIPIEPAYLVAVKEDPELWSYAYAKRILLISPTNLIACLKLMADLWKREKQSRNAIEIVRRGELLFDKFVGFIETMQGLGSGIDKTKDLYDRAFSQLKDGRGNLISQAQQLKDLGLKANKELPQGLLE